MVCNKWYQSWFNELYLPLYNHRDISDAQAFVAFAIKHLNLNPAHKILDLCCGKGRHMDIFLKQGFNVFGLDLSLFLLKQGKKENNSKQMVQGEMSRLPYKKSFDAVVNFFTSFGYYETDGENLEVLKQIGNVLKPTGRFLIDLPHAEYTLNNLVREDRTEINNLTFIQSRKFNARTKRIEKDITIQAKNEEHHFWESVRLYTPDDMDGLVKSAGLSVKDMLDLSGKPLTSESERMLVIGENP
jgi:SAM-dependent methyltransferase